MPIHYFEWKVFKIIWLKAFFSEIFQFWPNSVQQMHYRLLVNTAFSKSKHGFIFLAGNYVGTNDQFEVTNYSWISILLKSQKTYGLELDQIHEILETNELSHFWQDSCQKTAICICPWIYAVEWTRIVLICDAHWLSDWENLLTCPGRSGPWVNTTMSKGTFVP